MNRLQVITNAPGDPDGIEIHVRPIQLVAQPDVDGRPSNPPPPHRGRRGEPDTDPVPAPRPDVDGQPCAPPVPAPRG
jgi:hypothetical protein